MGRNMTENDAYAILKMTNQLRNDVLGIINRNRLTFPTPYLQIEMYNNILTILPKKFPESDIVKSFRKITIPNFGNEYESKFFEVYSATGQLISFLGASIGDPDKEIKDLNTNISVLEDKNKMLEEINKLGVENLNKYINAEAFPVAKEIWNKIPKDLASTLQDAIRAYAAGSYTACVCVCRNIIEGLVQELCTKEGIKMENGLNKKIEALIENKKITEKHHQNLLKAVSVFGNRSAHPTTEVFTKEKASLVLNGLLILIDEVFT